MDLVHRLIEEVAATQPNAAAIDGPTGTQHLAGLLRPAHTAPGDV